MAYKAEGPYHSFAAGAAIAAYRFVKGGAADDTVIQAAAATDIGVGAVEREVASGSQANVQLFGIAKVIVGVGGVTRWTRVTSDATGQAVAWVTKQECYGLALQSGVAGDIVSVLLFGISIKDEVT